MEPVQIFSEVKPPKVKPRISEERVGFEPTDAFAPAVFGTAALNRTLPPLLS